MVPNEIVIQIKVEGDRAVSVATPFTRHEADAFILAAGAWSGEVDGLPPGVAPPVKPIKGQMLGDRAAAWREASSADRVGQWRLHRFRARIGFS